MAKWRSRRWDEMSWKQRIVLMALVAVQVSLAVSAWTDLAQRPSEQVNGRKRTWAAVIGINFIGPLAYFRWGRRDEPQL
jgi:heme A synthase